MAQFRVAPESINALKARLQTPEGQAALDRLARIIIDRAVEATPPELRSVLGTPEARPLLEELWPEIVAAFFKTPVPPTKRRRVTK